MAEVKVRIYIKNINTQEIIEDGTYEEIREIVRRDEYNDRVLKNKLWSVEAIRFLERAREQVFPKSPLDIVQETPDQENHSATGAFADTKSYTSIDDASLESERKVDSHLEKAKTLILEKLENDETVPCASNASAFHPSQPILDPPSSNIDGVIALEEEFKSRLNIARSKTWLTKLLLNATRCVDNFYGGHSKPLQVKATRLVMTCIGLILVDQKEGVQGVQKSSFTLLLLSGIPPLIYSF